MLRTIHQIKQVNCRDEMVVVMMISARAERVARWTWRSNLLDSSILTSMSLGEIMNRQRLVGLCVLANNDVETSTRGC